MINPRWIFHFSIIVILENFLAKMNHTFTLTVVLSKFQITKKDTKSINILSFLSFLHILLISHVLMYEPFR